MCVSWQNLVSEGIRSELLSEKMLFSEQEQGSLWAARSTTPREKKVSGVKRLRDAKILGQTSHGTEPAIAFSQVTAAPSALWLVQEIHHCIRAGGKSPWKAKANQQPAQGSLFRQVWE